MRRRKARGASAGFTLMEAMLALALMATIVLGLSTITGQWLPNWRRGFVNLQRSQLLSLGLERVAADIASAEFVTPNGAAKELLFDGRELSVTLVRSALGPDQHPHLEVVRLAETVDHGSFALVRTRAPFTRPLSGGATPRFDFVDPVVLVRAPFRVSFAYAGPDRTWVNSWGPDTQLPSAVRISVRDSLSDRVLAFSTAVALKVTASGVPAPTPTPSPPAQPSQPGAQGQPPTNDASGQDPTMSGTQPMQSPEPL
jgi:general secretion pathway protein J